MIHTLLAIDPSIRSCGWAKFVQEKLVASGTVKSRLPFPQAAQHIVAQLTSLNYTTVFRLVIEFPTYQASLRGKLAMVRGDILRLSFLCGMLVSTFRARKLILPTPIQWKGNVPKEVTQARLRRDGYSFHTSDEADAIALGLWALRTVKE